MKKFGLSLCAFVLCSSFSSLSATPLDDVIKDIEVSGIARYRYYMANGDRNDQRLQYWGGVVRPSDNQYHSYRLGLSLKGKIEDNLAILTHFEYISGDYSYGPNAQTKTLGSFYLKQLYAIYSMPDLNTDIQFGRQYVDSIWTVPNYYKEGYGKDAYGGLIGTGVAVLNHSLENVNFKLFAYDSLAWQATGLSLLSDGKTFTDDGSDIQADVGQWVSSRNLYGATANAKYDTSIGSISPEVWLGYLPDRALMYAGVVTYNTNLFDDASYTLTGTYLGNKVNSLAKSVNKFTNGNYFQLDASLTYNEWDAGLGALHYGNKKHKSFTIIEDQGSLNVPAGYDILYTNGSRLSGDMGENTFAYLSGGYTFFEKLRLGAEFIYGGTKLANKHDDFKASYDNGTSVTTKDLTGQAGKKMEYRLVTSYKVSPKLSVSAFYSHLNVDRKSQDGHMNVARLQAFYRF